MAALCLTCSGFGSGLNIVFAVLTRIVAIPMCCFYFVMGASWYFNDNASVVWQADCREAGIFVLLLGAVEFLILLILPFRKKIIKLRK